MKSTGKEMLCKEDKIIKEIKERKNNMCSFTFEVRGPFLFQK
jgi:hypothetical protein